MRQVKPYRCIKGNRQHRCRERSLFASYNARWTDKYQPSTVKIGDFNDAIHASRAETMTVGVWLIIAVKQTAWLCFWLKLKQQKLMRMLKDFDNADEMTNWSYSIKKWAISLSSYIGSVPLWPINLSIPYVSIDMAGALMSVPIINLEQSAIKCSSRVFDWRCTVCK